MTRISSFDNNLQDYTHKDNMFSTLSLDAKNSCQRLIESSKLEIIKPFEHSLRSLSTLAGFRYRFDLTTLCRYFQTTFETSD